MTKALFRSWRGDRPLGDRPAAARESLLERAPMLAAMTDEAPLERAAGILAEQDPKAGYEHVPPELTHLTAALAARFGEEAASHYLSALLLHLIDTFEGRFERSRLHGEFHGQFLDSFHRILDQVRRGAAYVPSLGLDGYLKDLGICRLRVLPAVGQLVCPWSGVSRLAILKRGPAAVAHVWGRCGGHAPYFEMHTHMPMIRFFTPDGWEECYRLTALAFETYPQMRGLTGASWFFDPQLETISPSLGFIRHVPLAKGAALIRMGTDAQAIADATFNSPARKALYDEGAYVPVAHLMIWPARDLLRHYRP